MTNHLPVHHVILLAHGSSTPTWAAPFRQLQVLLQTDNTPVHLAFISSQSPTLPQAAADAIAAGAGRVTVLPALLGAGVHALEDIGRDVAALHAAYPAVTFTVAPVLGANEAVLEAIATALRPWLT